MLKWKQLGEITPSPLLWLLLRCSSSGWGGGWRSAGRMAVVTAVVAVMTVVWHVASVWVGVCVRVWGLWGGAGVLWRAQGMLAWCGVGVAGRHHGRRHWLLRCGKYLQGSKWCLLMYCNVYLELKWMLLSPLGAIIFTTIPPFSFPRQSSILKAALTW